MRSGINKKKIGCVIITKELLEQSYTISRCIFSHFFPIYAHDDDAGRIVYIGYCRHFEEIKNMEEVPKYDILFERKNGRGRFVKVIKL